MRIRNLIIGLCVLIGVYFLFDSLSQPNPNTLEGDFKEVAMYRNPNNTGPVIRVFAVTVADTLWEQMRQYGDMMPYTKYGTTTVYFLGKEARSRVKFKALHLILTNHLIITASHVITRMPWRPSRYRPILFYMGSCNTSIAILFY